MPNGDILKFQFGGIMPANSDSPDFDHHLQCELVACLRSAADFIEAKGIRHIVDELDGQADMVNDRWSAHLVVSIRS